MSEREPELWTGDRGSELAGQFGSYGDHDEMLHPLAVIPGDSLTETWAYMWYIPQERISAMIHIWVHPNLNVVTAGIGVWRGHKPSMISSELMDVPTFMSASDLGNGMDMKFPHGLHVEILEPFRKVRIRYEDRLRGNGLDLMVTDFSPVMRGSGTHFDQATHNRGTLTLRGRSYAVDGYGMRDRSWGQLRSEALMPTPPFTWMTGTFPRKTSRGTYRPSMIPRAIRSGRVCSTSSRNTWSTMPGCGATASSAGCGMCRRSPGTIR